MVEADATDDTDGTDKFDGMDDADGTDTSTYINRRELGESCFGDGYKMRFRC